MKAGKGPPAKRAKAGLQQKPAEPAAAHHPDPAQPIFPPATPVVPYMRPTIRAAQHLPGLTPRFVPPPGRFGTLAQILADNLCYGLNSETS